MSTNEYFVYILCNQRRTTLYVGITNDIASRLEEHQQKRTKGFTAAYNVTQLVYLESFESVVDAISREKQLKRWRREKKVWLIETMNPEWKPLSP